MSFTTRHDKETYIKSMVDSMFEFYHQKTCAEISNDSYHIDGSAVRNNKIMSNYKDEIIQAIENIR